MPAIKSKINLVLLSVLLLSGCTLIPLQRAEKLSDVLEGTWTESGILNDGNLDGGGFGWYLEYTFVDGRYEMTGYPSIGSSGSYSVVTRYPDGSLDVQLVPDDVQETSYTWKVLVTENTLDVDNGVHVFTRQ